MAFTDFLARLFGATAASPDPTPATVGTAPPPLEPPPHPRPPQRGMQTAGRLWRHAGGAWEQITDENDDPVQEIWSTPDESHVYVATWGGVFRRDPTGAWHREKPAIRRAVSVWGDGTGKVYATGGGGIASTRGDGRWTVEHTSGAGAVCGLAPDDVWATGGGALWHTRGDGRWERVNALSDASMFAMGTDGRTLFAAGDGGTVLVRPPGGPWRVENVGGTEQLTSVWCGGGRVYVAGTAVFQRVADGWKRLELPTTRQILGIGGFGDHVVAVGLGGTVLHRVGEGAFAVIPSAVRCELNVVHGCKPGVWYLGGEQFYED